MEGVVGASKSGANLPPDQPKASNFVIAPKDLGLINDLMNIGLPGNHADTTRSHNGGMERNEAGRMVFDSSAPSDLTEVDPMGYDRGYISDTTDLSQDMIDRIYHNELQHQDFVDGARGVITSDVATVSYDGSPATNLREELEQAEQEDQLISINHNGGTSSYSYRKGKKGRSKGKRKRPSTEADQNQGLNGPRRPCSRASSTPENQDGGYSASGGRSTAGCNDPSQGTKTGRKARTKLLRPCSIPGVLSDDEYTVSDIISSVQRAGRRSAPIFTKRGSTFFNSGQTAIMRTQHIQGFTNAQVHDGTRATGVFRKPTGRKDAQSQQRQKRHQYRDRSCSVGAEPNRRRRRFDRISEENEQVSSNTATSTATRGTAPVKNYGSTATRTLPKRGSDSSFSSDNRGYFSECETETRRYQEYAINDPDIQYWSVHDRRLRSPMDWDDVTSNQQGDKDLEKMFQESVEKMRSHGSRGVFRTPHSVTPRDLRVGRGRDALAVNQTSGVYVEKRNKEAETNQQHKQPSVIGDAIEPADGDNDDDEDDEDDDDDDDEDGKGSGDEEMPMLVGSGADEKYDIRDTRTEVYRRRWYLLFVFSFCSLMWNAIWSTWGPIAQTAKMVYDWSDGDIAMFTWLGNIPFLVTMFPIAYLMDVKGMRVAMILCGGLMFLGAGFRCIPSDIASAKWLINTGQLLNGIAGTVPVSGPALLSGLWFPPNQRATATAISTVAGYMGACVSFVVGPLLVTAPNLAPINNTAQINYGLVGQNGTKNNTDYSAQKEEIMHILYFEFGLATLVFLLVLLYFPSKPPLPPSISASLPREEYVNGLKMLVRNKQFWVTAVAYSVPIGVYEVWQVVLDVNLDPKVSQQTAGWLDFYATMGGCVSGMLVSRFADFFTRQMKMFLLVFYVFSAVAMLWFTLVAVEIIPFDTVSIYAAIIITGVFLDGGAPLFFELVIEVSYPVGEGVTSGLAQMLCASAGIVFLSLVQIESLGKEWMNWVFFGCVTMAVPLLFFIKTDYGRADIDDMDLEVSSSESEDEEAAVPSELPIVTEKTALIQNPAA